MTKTLLQLIAAACALALITLSSAIYGMKFGAEERQKLIVGQCTAGGQFVIKRTVYKCEKVKHGVHKERKTVPQAMVD